MNDTDRKKLYLALAAPFSEEAVERTDGKMTGKGYSTTGIKYQYVVNRLNEVLGFGCFRSHRTITVKETKRANGRPAFEAICDLTLELGQWVDGRFIVFAESLADGGHVASSEADSRKGAYTNAFKKAARKATFPALPCENRTTARGFSVLQYQPCSSIPSKASNSTS